MSRLLALVFALALGGAPVMVQVCEIHCAHRVEHSCHDGARGTGASLSGAPHACGHSEEQPTVAAPPLPASVPAVSAVAASIAAAADVRTTSALLDASPPLDPIPLALRTPIRV